MHFRESPLMAEEFQTKEYCLNPVFNIEGDHVVNVTLL